jgi:hypothetical protein
MLEESAQWKLYDDSAVRVIKSGWAGIVNDLISL